MKLYIDTCVYLDYINYNKEYSFEDRSEEILRFFQVVINQDHKVILSSWVKEELKLKLAEIQEEISIFDELFDNLNKIDIVYTEDDKKEAKRISFNNWQDALHVILAKKANAIMVITQNIRDFNELCKDIEYMNTKTFMRKYSH